MSQDFRNHSRFVTGYHRVLFVLLLAGLGGSVNNLIKSINTDNFYSASLLVLLFIIVILVSWYVRAFPLKAQDRAIRAEENLRFYVLTGNLLPRSLKMSQIVALRFAPDEEFTELASRAVTEQLTAREIKSLIKNWKADHYRV